MFDFNSLPEETKLLILSFLAEDTDPFSPITFKSLMDVSKTSWGNHRIANDEKLWKLILDRIIRACGYKFSDQIIKERIYLHGFENNMKELAILIILHNFRTHFTKWPDPSTERNSAVTNSINALSGLTNDQTGNLIIKIMLAELKFTQHQYEDSKKICIQLKNQYPQSMYLGALNTRKIDQSRSVIDINKGKQPRNPIFQPYQYFSVKTAFAALTINSITANKVLVELANQAKKESKIEELNLITINIALTLMQCSYSDKVIEMVGIEGILRFGENLYQLNSIPASNYVSEFSVTPFPSFLYLICLHGLENLEEFIISANQFYPTVADKDGHYFSKYSLLSHTPHSLKRAGFLRLLEHFSTYEITKLSQYGAVADQNKLKCLCDMNDAAFKLLINKLMEFKNFYAANSAVDSFNIIDALLLDFDGKLLSLQKENAIPLIKKFNLEELAKFNIDLLAKLCSVNPSNIINHVDCKDLFCIRLNYFEMLHALCNFENGKLIKDRWITVNQFIALSKDRKELLSKLLSIINRWTKEQFRLILNIGRIKGNPFKADKIKLLNKILDYIPADFSFKSMQTLITSDALLQDLATKCNQPNCNIGELLNQFNESPVLEKHELKLMPANKNWHPSHWQKPTQESLQNKMQDKMKQEDSNSSSPKAKRFKKEPESELEENNSSDGMNLS